MADTSTSAERASRSSFLPGPPGGKDAPSGRELCIAHVDAETAFGGGEVQVFLLMEGLRARGHRCVLFCPPGSASEGEAARRGFEVRPVPMRNYLDLPAVRSLARGFRALRTDLAHLHTGRSTWLGGLAAARLRLPAVTTRRMDRIVKRNWRTRLIYGSLVQRAVAISPGVLARLHAGGVDPEMCVLIYSAVDPARVVPRSTRAEVRAGLGVPESEAMVLAAGSLYRTKGYDVLLDALSLLEREQVRPRLVIAGEGPERASLLAKAQALGLDVQLLGARDDVADLLASCDVFASPSRHEGLGIAALEAMASGIPVLACSVGGLADSIVHEETGLLVPSEDAPRLAQALARLLRDGELRARLGAGGRRRVAEVFAPEPMVASYERLYRELIESRSVA
jgi:glycosyltransferase involved in cell wall biosynthesis